MCCEKRHPSISTGASSSSRLPSSQIFNVAVKQGGLTIVMKESKERRGPITYLLMRYSYINLTGAQGSIVEKTPK
jgi:hypothetical protein